MATRRVRPAAKKVPAKKKAKRAPAAKTKVPAKKPRKRVTDKKPVPPKKKKVVRKSSGRPTKYEPGFNANAAKLALKGWTDVEIADFFGVDVRTLYRWKSEHDEFCQALKLHKSPADGRVEASLYQRALGYSVDETDIRVVKGKIVKTVVRKHYPPDPTSMIFWLKNRKPEDWRAQPDPTHSPETPQPVQVVVGVKSARKRPDPDDANSQ
jgi:hypothetical protein